MGVWGGGGRSRGAVWLWCWALRLVVRVGWKGVHVSGEGRGGGMAVPGFAEVKGRTMHDCRRRSMAVPFGTCPSQRMSRTRDPWAAHPSSGK